METMATSASADSALHALFAHLIDDAGLFPPAALGMEAAVERYLAARDGNAGWIYGRFVVSASRLDDMITVLRKANPATPIPLSVIVDSDPNPRNWFGSAQRMLADISLARSTVSQVAIGALEAALPPLTTKRESYDAAIGQFAALAGQANLRDLPIYLEIPRDARFRELLAHAFAALRRTHQRAKLRCGGLAAESFPSVEDVAAFVACATDEHVAFKGTAGLHHPIRHRDGASGFVMHGFVNLLAAAALAPRVDAATLAQIVAEVDSDAFSFDAAGMAWREVFATAEELVAARERFVSYGSCSLREPLDDLLALGILARSR